MSLDYILQSKTSETVFIESIKLICNQSTIFDAPNPTTSPDKVHPCYCMNSSMSIYLLCGCINACLATF